MEGNLDHIFLCVFNSFADCFRNLGCFAESVTYVAIAIAYNHQSCEASDTTTFNGFGYTVHDYELFLKLNSRRVKSLCHYFSPMNCLIVMKLNSVQTGLLSAR